jgi:hypothetical protein
MRCVAAGRAARSRRCRRRRRMPRSDRCAAGLPTSAGPHTHGPHTRARVHARACTNARTLALGLRRLYIYTARQQRRGVQRAATPCVARPCNARPCMSHAARCCKGCATWRCGLRFCCMPRVAAWRCACCNLAHVCIDAAYVARAAAPSPACARATPCATRADPCALQRAASFVVQGTHTVPQGTHTVPQGTQTVPPVTNTLLQPATSYVVRLSGASAAGTSAPSDSSSIFRTLARAPDAPARVWACAVDPHGALVGWEPGASAGGEAVRAHTLEQREVEDGALERADERRARWAPAAGHFCAPHSFMVSGLRPGRAYMFRVSAVNAAGASAFAELAAPMAAPRYRPEPIVRCDAAACTATSVTLRWCVARTPARSRTHIRTRA